MPVNFENIKKLGEGNQGVVWLSKDIRLGRKVAIKSSSKTSSPLNNSFICNTIANCRIPTGLRKLFFKHLRAKIYQFILSLTTVNSSFN